MFEFELVFELEFEFEFEFELVFEFEFELLKCISWCWKRKAISVVA